MCTPLHSLSKLQSEYDLIFHFRFDQPPTMKAGELEKRGEKRAEAMAAIEKAKEEGDMDEVDKQSRRIVKVRKKK